VSSKTPSRNNDGRWLTPPQDRAWTAFMRAQLRMNYEMNRQLQSDAGLSLSDYDVLAALSRAPDGRMQVTDLAAELAWERSRVSHQLRRMGERGLTERRPSTVDGRATDAQLTKKGHDAIAQAAPAHVDLVRRLFFDPLPVELLAPLTAALEHVNVNLDLHSSLPN